MCSLMATLLFTAYTTASVAVLGVCACKNARWQLNLPSAYPPAQLLGLTVSLGRTVMSRNCLLPPRKGTNQGRLLWFNCGI